MEARPAMRQLVAAMILLALTGAVCAQTDETGPNEIAPGLPSSPSAPSEPAPRNVVTCPLATTPMIDKWGNRVCVSRSQKPLQQPLPDGLTPVRTAKPKRKRLELSNKCPACK
jgi:hypothetical protein